MNQLGDVECACGHLDRAQECYERALVAFRDARDSCGAGRSLTDLGYIHLEEGRVDEARSAFRDSLGIFGSLSHRRGIARVLDGYATLALAGGDPVAALKLSAAASHILRQIDALLPRNEQARVDKTLESARALLQHGEANQAWTEGAAMSLDEAIAYARRMP